MFDFSAESLDSAVQGAYGKKPSATPQMPPRQRLSGANPQLQPDAEEEPPTGGFSFDAVSLNNAVRDAIKGEPSKVSQVAKSKFGSMSELGQGLASLADVTVGGVIPAVAGSVTYAGARALGKTPEQATRLEQQVVGATEKPFGKAFGVTETAGYQGEASRQLMDFIGQNVSKGADWIAQKTGLPASDVQNMIGTLTAAASPAGAKAVASEAKMIGQAVADKFPKVEFQQLPTPQAAQVAPVAQAAPAAKTVAETLAEQKAVKGTPAPTFKIPEEVPPMPEAPLPSAEIASREAALKKVGIDRIRTSALENNPKEASSQFITSQASQEPYGHGMTEQINYEKSKMNDYFAGIEKKSGGNVVRYGTPDEVADKIKEGQIYKGALQKGYDKWTKEGENLYKKAEQQHGDKPVVLQSVSDYLKNNANFAYDPEISLKKGIISHLKNQDLINKDGSLKPMSVAQAEQLRKYINSKYNPNSYAVAKDMKGLIDENVFTQVGGKTYEDARLHWGKGKDIYENPKAMGDLLGDNGVNQKIPDEKVAEKIAALPQSQFNHLVNTLNADKQSAAVRQLQTTLVNRIRKAGESAVNQPYNSIAAAKEASALSEKLRVAFSNNPKLLQQVYDGVEAGNILHIPSKYPGAAVQTHLLQNKFTEMALQKGATTAGGALGAALGGVAGAGVGAMGGEMVGSKVAESMRAKRQIKQLGKEIKQIKLSDIGKE